MHEVIAGFLEGIHAEIGKFRDAVDRFVQICKFRVRGYKPFDELERRTFFDVLMDNTQAYRPSAVRQLFGNAAVSCFPS